MKINHRIALRSDDPIWNVIISSGIRVDSSNPTIWVTNVTEDDIAWPKMQQVLLERPHSELVTNIFTKKELNAAEWLEMSALGHHGYPMPDDDFGYVKKTYDTADYCPKCGIRGKQKAPFRFRSEPKASHSQFLQLNWVFDEFFLRKSAMDGFVGARITGIEFLPPLLHKSNRPSEQVSQLVVKTILPTALNPIGLQTVTCKEDNEECGCKIRVGEYEPFHAENQRYCGRVKYHYMHKGPFKINRSAFDGAPDIVKSFEWFGSGASAHRLVIVSQRVYQTIMNAKWRGVSFEPIDLV